MASMDVFTDDAFSTRSLTAVINMLPYQPGKVGALGLFKDKSIPTTYALVENKKGRLSLLNTAARGSAAVNPRKRGAREARNFQVPHIPQYSQVMADDVLNLRAFGSETELDAVSAVVTSELAEMRASHEVTQEFHRVRALQGTIVDGDASTTIYNLYTEFGLSQKTVTFDFTATGNQKTKSTEIIRHIEDGMGGSFFSGIGAICGNSFWDSFIVHATVEDAYARWQDGAMLRTQQRPVGGSGSEPPMWFPFAGINWCNYRGAVGGTKFVADAEAYFFPLGTTDDTFIEILSPADTVETVGTMGQRFYAMQENMPFDKGIRLHTQSNTLPLCTRMDALVKGS
jgi:hypothetical protein